MTYIIPAADLLAPNFGLVIWITIVFGLMLFILRKFAWGPITSALENRERTIQESFDRAEKALAEAKRLQEENDARRREAELQMQSALRAAREETERLRAEELEQTRRQLRAVQQQAEADIERQKQSALAELRKEVADLALDAAGKVLREEMNTERQRRLVNAFLNDLPKNEPQA